MPLQAPLSYHFDLFAYWHSKRRTRTMPARSDISPAEIPLLLPYLMIIEGAGDQFRYRLVGSAIVRSVGYDATGAIVGSYIAEPETAAQVRAIFGRVFKAAGPVFAAGQYFHKTGFDVNLSLLTLPLSEDGQVVNMSISTLVTCFSATLTPERGWLKGLPVKVNNVRDIRGAAELDKFCREWERRCVSASTAG